LGDLANVRILSCAAAMASDGTALLEGDDAKIAFQAWQSGVV
jgi:hypothetical protein